MHVKFVIRWQLLALFVLALLGLGLRFYNIDWDQGNNFHPDERQLLFHVTAVSWPTSFGQFLDPVHSPLNPHFFAYGSFPIYLLALLGHIFLRPNPASNIFVSWTLLGRATSAIFDTGTVLLTAWLGFLLTKNHAAGRSHAWNVALLAAALVVFTPFQLQLSHFYTVDTLLLFFVMLTLLACVGLVESERPVGWSLVVGLGYGLALATKFSAAPLAVPLLFALLLRGYRRRNFIEPLLLFVNASLSTLVVCLIAQPYVMLDWPNFVQQVAEQGSLARGMLDLPYVRQFAGTTPYAYEAENMLLWGMGITLGASACAGLLWFLWRAWRREAGAWLIVISWVLVYSVIIGSFYVKFMRYMLPVYPLLTLLAAAALLALVRRCWDVAPGAVWRLDRFAPIASVAVIVLVFAGTIFQGLALLNVYSQPNTRVQASLWIYKNLRAGSLLTYEQWDDPLPVAIDGYSTAIYPQATYLDGGQTVTGLDLYSDDTVDKARQLANLLPTLNAITMATNRLDKSIPRLPARYPLTIHYYQLLFSGQLGFHLAKQFENHPNLFGIVLNDSNADESYSVFDHPTVRIFVRDNSYPYTSEQLFQKLMQGVQLPAPGANLSGAQRSLLLSQQQINDNQQSPAFSVQFPANSFSNAVPVFSWWLMLTLAGLLVYPLVFLAFRGLADRGYIFSKTLGILLLAYLAWLLAATHILAFERLSLLLVLGFLFLCGVAAFLFQRASILAFVRQHWRRIVLLECMFTLAFLFFVGIRAFNPDLFHVYRSGEKPMELAFLNAILRSPYMPPYDPWFSGGYINYYYYGYVIIGSLIKLTGIVPTTAFNLAIPTLFAMTVSGAVIIVYSLGRSIPIALLGGYFAALIGNFDGFVQLRGQLFALLAHVPIPPFDYWQSSRVIPFTINEFPFWSFLFADMHPHVINMPITVLMLGILAALLLSSWQPDVLNHRLEQRLLFLLAAFVFGTLICVNPWDMPASALLLAGVLLMQVIREKRQEALGEVAIVLGFRLVLIALLCGLGYLFYLPFYRSYQELYVNGLGLVKQGSDTGSYLTFFGFWLFIALSFFIAELYRRWLAPRYAAKLQATMISAEDGTNVEAHSAHVHTAIYIVLSVGVLIVLMVLGLKVLLLALLVLGLFLLLQSFVGQLSVRPKKLIGQGAILSDMQPALFYTYLLLVMGVAICSGIEVVYVRDFLDGGDYARMNTVFKFSILAWFCFAIGGALAVQHLWRTLSGLVRRMWMALLVAFVLCCSVFLVEGTSARIYDHQVWAQIQKPVASSNYTPTLDGFAFAHTWYPGDAEAISWLNAHVAGSPVILEAAAQGSFQWYDRVSVYTGLPDVLGWPDHVGEQRYGDQISTRQADIGQIYNTPDSAQALALLRAYHVRYIYVGALERQLYAANSSAGLDKFNTMVGRSLRIVYRADGVMIYELM